MKSTSSPDGIWLKAAPDGQGRDQESDLKRREVEFLLDVWGQDSEAGEVYKQQGVDQPQDPHDHPLIGCFLIAQRLTFQISSLLTVHSAMRIQTTSKTGIMTCLDFLSLSKEFFLRMKVPLEKYSGLC